MAAAVRIVHDIAIGDTEHLYTGEIDFDSSYPTGGEVIDASNNATLETVIAQSKSGYVFSWDKVNQKLLAYVTKDPGNAGGADVVLQQVANTTDLSALTGVQFMAVGS